MLKEARPLVLLRIKNCVFCYGVNWSEAPVWADISVRDVKSASLLNLKFVSKGQDVRDSQKQSFS